MFKSLLIVTALFVGIMAHADTIILKDKPANVITVGDAAKSKTPVFECVLSHSGPRVNPVKVLGTNSIWSSKPGTAIDNAGELLASGKNVFICKSKLMDNTTGRMKSAAL